MGAFGEERSFQMAQKKKMTEREQAEKRFRQVLDKRDELNKAGDVIRQERDILHSERKRIQDEMQGLRDQRKAAVDQMRLHKAARNEAQKKAKELIKFKKTAMGKVFKNLDGEIEAYRSDLKFLELKQQTQPMSVQKENDLLDQIRKKQDELPEMEQLLKEQASILAEVDDLNEAITELFKKGDEEHEKVVEFNKTAQEIHEKIEPLAHEVKHLFAEADKKHELYLKYRERAQTYHEKAMEMRKKVLAIRKAEQSELEGERALVNEQNKAVSELMDDEKKLNEAADEAMQLLLKKGKFSL